MTNSIRSLKANGAANMDYMPAPYRQSKLVITMEWW